jgi:hypothetical protein
VVGFSPPHLPPAPRTARGAALVPGKRQEKRQVRQVLTFFALFGVIFDKQSRALS